MAVKLELKKPLLRIRAERQRRGWRLLDLAYHANVPVSELSRIETGQARAYPAYASRLSAVLNVPEEELQLVETSNES
jgi:transcriptional regulator with XRE-family HTH domain